ncbi:hypothetical protein [Chromobacterium amazonense]|nr:hypothetical protein [Chromobacterium amazonense]MDE1714779.1 hypothetical protein [Chromobacterium amazonense]
MILPILLGVVISKATLASVAIAAGQPQQPAQRGRRCRYIKGA